MTLEEAIKTLNRVYILHFDVPRIELNEAYLLGIEAMNAYAQARKSGLPLPWALLPSETTE